MPKPVICQVDPRIRGLQDTINGIDEQMSYADSKRQLTPAEYERLQARREQAGAELMALRGIKE